MHAVLVFGCVSAPLCPCIGLLDKVKVPHKIAEELRRTFNIPQDYDVGFYSSKVARLDRWTSVHVGDAVLLRRSGGGRAGGSLHRLLHVEDMQLHVTFQCAVVEEWASIEETPRWSSWHMTSRTYRFCNLEELECSVVWSNAVRGEGQAVLLDPRPHMH